MSKSSKRARDIFEKAITQPCPTEKRRVRHTIQDIRTYFIPAKRKCEVCGKPTKRRVVIGDFVHVCQECKLRSDRFERMDAAHVSAVDLDNEIDTAGVVNIRFERTKNGWACGVQTKTGHIGTSIQDTPFDALADAFFRLPVKKRKRRR